MSILFWGHYPPLPWSFDGCQRTQFTREKNDIHTADYFLNVIHIPEAEGLRPKRFGWWVNQQVVIVLCHASVLCKDWGDMGDGWGYGMSPKEAKLKWILRERARYHTIRRQLCSVGFRAVGLPGRCRPVRWGASRQGWCPWLESRQGWPCWPLEHGTIWLLFSENVISLGLFSTLSLSLFQPLKK